MSGAHGPGQRGPGQRFLGWRMVAFAAVMLGMSGPGQTVGVSVFVDPMMAALELTRSQVSTAYLIGTLLASLVLPRVGRLLDELGTRRTLLIVAVGLAAALSGMGLVVGIVTLTVGFVGIRMLGQGSLSLVATNAVAPWFTRRRGLAIGVVTAVGSSLIALVPLLSTFAIALVGWRVTWVVLAALVALLLVPIALGGFVDRPEDVGQRADGVEEHGVDGAATVDVTLLPSPGPAGVPAIGTRLAPGEGRRPYTRAEALRTPMLWALIGGSVTTGMLTTGMAFHQIDLLGEQGLTPAQAAANFLPQTVATFVTVLLVGALVDRVAPRWILAASMALLAGAMLALPAVRPGASAVAYGVALGAAGASARALEAGAVPRLYGLRHLGAIRGLIVALAGASTALGPLALSIGNDLTGGYTEVLRLLVVLPVAVAVFGMFVREPSEPDAPDASGEVDPAPCA
jgi:MFS family permease